jgi:hypothetical protein
MPQDPGSPFDSIESAHDFVILLAQTVLETKRDIDADIQRETNGKTNRRLEALRIASYSLDRLDAHLSRSRRILNDLRSLRRLLFQERTVTVQKKPQAIEKATPQTLATGSPWTLPAQPELSPQPTRAIAA